MKTFDIINLSSGIEYTFVESENFDVKEMLENRIKCLINTAISENLGATGIYSTQNQDKYRAMLTLGNKTVAIGDLCVSIKF